MRRMMRSSISVSSERFTNGSTSCSRVLTAPSALSSLLSPVSCVILGVPGAPSGNGHLVDDVGDHGVGRESMAGRVRAEPDAMAEDVGREILDVFRVDLGAPAHEQ